MVQFKYERSHPILQRKLDQKKADCQLSSVLNMGLHEILDVDPIIILIIFFCTGNTFLLNDEFHQNIIPYSLTEWQ
jgi:hypothetical protein